MKTLKYCLIIGMALLVHDYKVLGSLYDFNKAFYSTDDCELQDHLLNKKLLMAKLALNKKTQGSQVNESAFVQDEVVLERADNKAELKEESMHEKKCVDLPKTVEQICHHMTVEPSDNSSDGTCKWALPITVDYSVADDGFDCQSKKVPLSKALFGQSFTFKDIDLFTRLCYDSKVHIQNTVNPPQGDRTVPIGPNAPFGEYRDDLYPTLLATTNVDISASQKEMQVMTSIIRRKIEFLCGITGFFGMTIPIKYKSNTMNLSLYGGKLFSQIFSATQTVRENAGFQFFKDYEDVYDYFVRALVGSKGLLFEQNQSKFGFGDINFFVAGDFACLSRHLDSWQIGVNLVCPSGGKYKGNKVWELVLGNGGAWQLEAYSNVICTTPMWFLNPALRLSAQMSIPFNGSLRIPKVISNASAGTNTKVSQTPGLIAPENFANYWVSPFVATDSSIPWFADSAVCTRIRWGSRVLFGLGNYVYDLFCPQSRIGIFYDFAYKACDSYKVIPAFGCTQVYNVGSIIGLTKEKMHRLGWNWTYTFQKCGELMVGSQHIIAGQNIAASNEIFVTWTMVF